MPKSPGVSHTRAIRALEKAGYKVIRQSGHVVLSNGTRFVVVPRNNPINAFTMGGIVKDAGFTVDEFRRFL
jgi:predicted RNA binding protein YcfA (HicA-like mRNA interferase family)